MFSSFVAARPSCLVDEPGMGLRPGAPSYVGSDGDTHRRSRSRRGTRFGSFNFYITSLFFGVRLTAAFYNLGGLEKGGVVRRSDGRAHRESVVLGCYKFD